MRKVDSPHINNKSIKKTKTIGQTDWEAKN